MKFIVMGPLLRFFGRPKVTGAEHIPKRGGAIIASNHLAVADSFYMPLMIRRRVTFPAKQEYFTTGGLKGKAMKFFFSAAGQVPIDRSSGSAANAALITCKRLLAEGDLVGIYPEGTRSPDGRLYRGKTGVARMALEARVPVIPVAMVGTDEVNPVGSKMWRRGHVQVRFGEPLDFTELHDKSGNAPAERQITDRIMLELKRLGEQEYVDMYAAKVKTVMDKTGHSAEQVVRDIVATSNAPQRRLEDVEKP
ncbi:lysophospholipid acyltransferase family protein [Cumulibacter soli]|uniref:lysophospholipid acyltransferase family protein n=1 Tax=Cumulibacter soli TaxID=2546344 RepID=UPI001ABA8CBA|nr:lysophospholipid acyltransferase family protein [Cumulibacter soli]